MRSSLSLQRSLFKHQAQQIAAHVESGSLRFKAYQRRYERATQRARRRLTMAEVHARVAAADLVYVGDYHTLRAAQQAYLQLVEAAVRCGRRVVLALEFVEHRHQATLDAFLAGRLSDKRFLAAIAHPYRGPFDVWPGFAPILTLARKHGLEVRGIDSRAKGADSLVRRDVAAAKVIARAAAAADRPLVLTLVGQFHVAPQHLPREVARRLRAPRTALVVYQNAEAIHWSLARRGLVESTPAVELSPTELCLMNTSPVVCQRSFLDYVEAESDDALLDEPDIAHTFRHLARDLGRFIGVSVSRQAEQITVATAGDLDALEAIRARFDGPQLTALDHQLASRESAWIPRAKAVWLSSMSLNHAAEEAAHFVRFVCIGDDMDRPRSRAETFWARCYEEALGFFGSRLLNPRRRCTSVEEWTWHFQHGRAADRRIAAFVLALDAALTDDPAAARALVPQGDDALFNAVSHAVGYLVGAQLADAFAGDRLLRASVRALFRDRLADPAAAFAALRQGLTRER